MDVGTGFDIVQFIKDFQIVSILALAIAFGMAKRGFDRRLDKMEAKADARVKALHARLDKRDEEIKKIDHRVTSIEAHMKYMAGFKSPEA